jgi:hypothetical protein
MRDNAMVKVRVGDRYERLVVREKITGDKYYRWLCICDCGEKRIITGYDLTSGHRVSCGCKRRDGFARKGLSRTKEYKAWLKMIRRCVNSNDPAFLRYGGRGVKVCDRWLVLENFLSDMGPCPDGKSIDRVNNNGDYEPGNVRWATILEQNNNRRSCRYLKFNGQEKSLSDWAREVGIPMTRLRDRLGRGWAIERALTS